MDGDKEAIEKVGCNERVDVPSGANDGGSNRFYSIPYWVHDCDTLSEFLELDAYEFNILKTLWLNKGLRHNGTTHERELKKRLHYANRCIEKNERIKNERFS